MPKVLDVLAGVLKIKLLGKRIPLFCQWEVTFKCNMNCDFCVVPQNYKNWLPELDTEQALALVDELYENGTRIINFGGGEPFLRKDFLEIAERAKKKGMITFVNTNGSMLEENAERAVKAIDFIRVSLDGNSDFHNKIRRFPNAFEKAVAGVKKAKQLGGNIMLNTLITKKTRIEEIEELAGIAKEIGIRITPAPVSIALPCVANPKEKNLDKSQLELIPGFKEYFGMIASLKKKFPDTIADTPEYYEVMKKGGLDAFGCRAMDITIGIKPNGAISFPCADWPAKPKTGKVSEVFKGKEAEEEAKRQGKYWFCKNCTSRCAVYPTLLLSLKGMFSIAMNWRKQ